MRYKPERALTPIYVNGAGSTQYPFVEMRYKPERALTLISGKHIAFNNLVEMRYKPERALTQYYFA